MNNVTKRALPCFNPVSVWSTCTLHRHSWFFFFKTNRVIAAWLLSDVCIVLPVLLLATVWPFMVDLHSYSSQTSSWQQQMYWLRLMDFVQSAVDSKLLCVLGTGWEASNTPPVPVISLPGTGVETLCVDSQGLERLCWLMGVRWGPEGGNDPEKLQRVFLLRNLWPSFTCDRHSFAARMAETTGVSHKRRRAAT